MDATTSRIGTRPAAGAPAKPQPIDPALQIPAARCLLEYFVLQILDDIVEVLGDLEIAVDDVVEHAMDQHRRPRADR
jgi:hypothetical protein